MSDDPIRILGISGSLRRGSYSTMALRGLQEAVRPRAQVQIHSLQEIPLYNADLDGDIKPAAVVSLNVCRHDRTWRTRGDFRVFGKCFR